MGNEQPTGRMGLGMGRGLSGGLIGTFSITHGRPTEAMRRPYCAQVVSEDIEKLERAGTAIWESVYRTKKKITFELSEKK